MDHNKLKKVREKYNDLNDLPIQKRLAKSSPIELWTLETMNYHGVKYNNRLIKNWRKCRTKDDRTYKRDAESFVDDKYVYAQLKFRQPNSGTDVGCAIIQPYPGSNELRKIYKEEKDKMDFVYARDYKFEGIIYACLNNTWDKLMILPYQELVRPAYKVVLDEWLADNSPLDRWDRTFASKKYPGAELKWKEDSGKGWDARQEKLICYLPISLFDKDPRVTVVDMIDPPDYV